MAPHAPQIVQLLSVAFTAAAMVVLGRKKHMLEQRPPKRCASCGRFTEAGGRCAHCG